MSTHDRRSEQGCRYRSWRPGPHRRVAAALALAALGLLASCSLSESIDASEFRSDDTRGDEIVALDDLVVGDCVSFDTESGATVTGLLAVDCSRLHNLEVTRNESLATFGDAFPGDESMNRYGETTCEQAFRRYVGASAARDPDLNWVWFAPDARNWDDGDRTLLCLVESSELTRRTLRS